VAFFPEKYGEGLIRLASDILAHKAVPPACFIKHTLITRKTSIISTRTINFWQAPIDGSRCCGLVHLYTFLHFTST